MKRRPQKKRRGVGKKKPTRKRPLTAPHSMDKVMSDLHKLLAQQEFESEEEINAFLAENVMGKPLPAMAPETPLEEAQELIYEARETGSPRQRIRLAKKALQISEDCVDAYVLLAEEEARTLQEAQRLFAKGVAVGERLLGDEFEETVGYFWGVIETRPYMRARAGLASTLWQLGQHDAALAHYQEMLRLNPGDNQGVRYLLFNYLISHGRPDEIEALLAAYPDEGMAAWLYNWALYLFKYEGASTAANAKLAEAIAMNPHVPAYLLKQRRLPRQLPAYIGFGDEDEAVHYVYESQQLWNDVSGALAWLKENE